MRNKFLVIILIVVSLLLVAYTWLGGFQKAVIKRTTLEGCLIMGKEFFGEAKSDSLGSIFTDIQILRSEGKVSGTPVVIYYNTMSSKEDSVHAFVGLMVKDSSQTLPKNFKYKSIPAQKGLQARLNINSLVLTPQKIEDAHVDLNEFAKKEKISLQPYAIEKYLSDREFLLEIPEKK